MIPAGRPHYLNFRKSLMASDSSSGFSHLWPGVFHISLRILKAQPREWKKRINEQTWTCFFSASAKGGSMWQFLSILWANASVYSNENSHKATRNADSSLDYPVLSTGLCGSLLLTVSFPWLTSPADYLWHLFSLVFFRSRGKSCAQVPYVWFHTKTDKEILWLTPTPTEIYATHSVTAN